MIGYIGTTNKYPHTIQIPQNSIDNVDAGTVNPAFQVLADQTHYVSAAISAYRPHVYLKWLTNNSMSLNAFGPISVSSTAPPTAPLWWQVSLPLTEIINPTKLEAGPLPNFVGSTAYYIYLTVQITGFTQTPKIVISEDPPDETLSFKQIPLSAPLITHRYLGSFVTTAGGFVEPFSMTDFRYLLQPPTSLATLASVAAGTYTVDIGVPGPILLSNKKAMIFRVEATTLEVTPSTWRYKGKGWTFTNPTPYVIIYPGAGTSNLYSYWIEAPTGVDNKVTFELNTSGSGNTVLEIYLMGYVE